MEHYKYIVVDTRGRDNSVWTEVFNTAEEANAAAAYQWETLTAYDKKGGRSICAGLVTLEDLEDYATDEDTEGIDWTAWKDYRSFPGAFERSV